ncbi:MAG: sugar kinase [Armatimonadetes bacterium]|nr:sugar kinase [Armatimonadota bacterium]MDW8120766.1 sugar kinase [Armatimonadota bacterium]
MRAPKAPKVVSLGEAMIRLTPPDHQRLLTTDKLEIHIGGAELNVAVALAQLDVPAAWVSKLPLNALGQRVCREAARFGVDTSAVLWHPNGKMGLYFYERGAGARAGTVFYDRAGSAINFLDCEELDWDFIGQAQIFHITGITPALSERARKLTENALKEAKKRGMTISFDVNYRSRLWNPEKCRQTLERLLPNADIVICTERDGRTVFGWMGTAEEMGQQFLLQFGVRAVTVTQGARGVTLVTSEGTLFESAIGTEVVDRLGAGDAFAAGLIFGILHKDLHLGVRYGLAMAALKHTIPGDWFIGSRQEVEELLTGEAGGVRR